jgi:hypothetical protein
MTKQNRSFAAEDMNPTEESAAQTLMTLGAVESSQLDAVMTKMKKYDTHNQYKQEGNSPAASAQAVDPRATSTAADDLSDHDGQSDAGSDEEESSSEGAREEKINDPRIPTFGTPIAAERMQVEQQTNPDDEAPDAAADQPTEDQYQWDIDTYMCAEDRYEINNPRYKMFSSRAFPSVFKDWVRLPAIQHLAYANDHHTLTPGLMIYIGDYEQRKPICVSLTIHTNDNRS